ncbi:hypothetical protein ACOSP7_004575 [Xanthoceras sorbifolium]
MGFHFRFSYGGMKLAVVARFKNEFRSKRIYYTYKFPSSTTGRASLNNMTYVM